jgi:hypothetical protein
MREERESDVEKALIAGTKARKGEIRKVQWIGRRGAPDRRVMLPNMCVWVELKKPGKALETHQKREHTRMKAQGERIYVLDSVAEVENFFLIYDGFYSLIKLTERSKGRL